MHMAILGEERLPCFLILSTSVEDDTYGTDSIQHLLSVDSCVISIE